MGCWPLELLSRGAAFGVGCPPTSPEAQGTEVREAGSLQLRAVLLQNMLIFSLVVFRLARVIRLHIEWTQRSQRSS